MIEGLIRAVSDSLTQPAGQLSVTEVGQIMEAAWPHVQTLKVTKEGLPYGRYLLHRDPKDRFNIQVMVYSADYTGSIHSHSSWGMLFALKGGLHSYDYLRQNSETTLIRRSFLGGGACQCFASFSDWHQVRSPATGAQTVTLHIYGEGFDLDMGTYLDENFEAVRASRSAWGDPAILAVALKQQERD